MKKLLLTLLIVTSTVMHASNGSKKSNFGDLPYFGLSYLLTEMTTSTTRVETGATRVETNAEKLNRKLEESIEKSFLESAKKQIEKERRKEEAYLKAEAERIEDHRRKADLAMREGLKYWEEIKGIEKLIMDQIFNDIFFPKEIVEAVRAKEIEKEIEDEEKLAVSIFPYDHEEGNLNNAGSSARPIKRNPTAIKSIAPGKKRIRK